MAGEGRGVIALLTAGAERGLVVVRVFVFVGVALAIFIAAYLGYFVLPFVFVLLAFGILGMTGATRHLARLRRRFTRR